MSHSLGIVIPTFNDEGTLRETLESIVRQTRLPDALYVVDDGSTDSTLSVAAEFKDKLPITIFSFESNLGLVGNWNRCIEVAREDFVWILHSDDWLHPQAVRLASDLIDSDKCDIFSTGGIMLASLEDEVASKWAESNMEPRWSHVFTGVEGFILALRLICSSVVVRRRLYQEHGSFSIDFPYSPDEELWPRLAMRSRLVLFEGGYLTAVRTSGAHEMHRTWRRADFVLRWNYLHRQLAEMASNFEDVDRQRALVSIEEKRRSVLEWVQGELRKMDEKRRPTVIGALRIFLNKLLRQEGR